METKVTLSELEQAKVLFPEEIEELKEDFEIMSSKLTFEQMQYIRNIFKSAKGVVNRIMCMGKEEMEFAKELNLLGRTSMSFNEGRHLLNNSLKNHYENLDKLSKISPD